MKDTQRIGSPSRAPFNPSESPSRRPPTPDGPGKGRPPGPPADAPLDRPVPRPTPRPWPKSPPSQLAKWLRRLGKIRPGPWDVIQQELEKSWSDYEKLKRQYAAEKEAAAELRRKVESEYDSKKAAQESIDRISREIAALPTTELQPRAEPDLTVARPDFWTDSAAWQFIVPSGTPSPTPAPSPQKQAALQAVKQRLEKSRRLFFESEKNDLVIQPWHRFRRMKAKRR